jgi:hypothetical protein
MSLRSTREQQSKIIWEVLFCAELKALFGANTNVERVNFIQGEMNKLKNKPWAYKSLNKVIRSSNVSKYVLEVGKALQPTLANHNVVYRTDINIRI